MTPKISSLMQKALANPETRAMIDAYFEDPKRKPIVIKIDGKLWQLKSVTEK